MSDTSPVRADTIGAVRVVTLNRPQQLNALSLDTLTVLSTHLEAVQNDPSIRALVITGAGRAFCAGADMADEYALSLGSDDPWSVAMHGVIVEIYRLRVPTIAALNGLAVGAGLDLALACSLRYAADTAWVSEGYVDIGYSPDAGATFLLPRIVGPARAAEMIFTGRRVDAATASDWGLVSRVVPADGLQSSVLTLAQEIAKKPPLAVELAKRLLDANADVSLEVALRNELIAGRLCGVTDDHHVAVSAIRERDPASEGD